jgi:hypothetical protein
MNQFYIQDTTRTKDQFRYFPTVQALVAYLPRVIQRQYSMTRAEYMQHLIDLGHGYDDTDGVTITRALSEVFNIGVVQNDGSHQRTDIHAVSQFKNENYGD